MSFVNNFIKIILRNLSEQSDKINEVMKKQKKFKILRSRNIKTTSSGFASVATEWAEWAICCVNRTFHPVLT